MDREKAKAIRAALEPLFGGVERALSVKFKIGNISYDPAGGHASVKLEVADVRADGTVASKEAEDFKRMAPVYGLPADALNKRIVYAGKSMEIIGLLPKCSRFPILCKTETGKRIKVTADGVLAALGVPRKPIGEVVFPRSFPKRDEKAIMEDIRHVHLELSPENLTCDGELPRAQVAVKATRLNAKLAALERELGRKPSEAEVWELPGAKA